MAQRLHKHLHSMTVLITQRQFRLIAAIHKHRHSDDHPISKASVMREALTTGLEAQVQQFNVPIEEETPE